MIHQPEFMPWSNLFTKMSCCDQYVFLDSVQYVRRSYHNRNKFKYSKGSYWLTVPIQKTSRNSLIKNILIDNSQDWKQSHKSFLTMAYKDASSFGKVMNIFEKIYEIEWDNLCDFNCYVIKTIAEYLGINNSFYRSSELSVSGEKSDRILNICIELQADRYICGIGSKSYLDENIFKNHSINIVYLRPMSIFHVQAFSELGFVDGLSIFDYLFNVGVDEVKKQIQLYRKEVLEVDA
jgi:hypothetical protein